MNSGDYPQREDRQRIIETANTQVDRVTGLLDRVLPFRSVRPLDRIPSIKLKLSILILSGIGISVTSMVMSYWVRVHPRYALVIGVALALALVQILARGITSPLREMSHAVDAMASGDLDQRVQASGADEIGQLGHSFNEMAARIADLERQRRDLIANVSHDLRTPIAVIQGNLENMVDGVVDDADATLRVMLRQTARLTRLVEQLLDLSRLEAGAVPMQAQPMDLRSVAERVVEEAEMHDPAPAILLRSPRTVPMVGDPERLHQVFANVLDNAIRFHTGDQPISMTISLHTDAGTEFATVEIQDAGPGIAPEDLSRIFERFHRADQHRTIAGGGSGLGLTICKWIVGLHDGTIHAANGLDGGAVLTIELPVDNLKVTELRR